MANLNSVHLIGRLVADPESRTFQNGGKVVNIRFAVNNRRKNPTTGQWEDEPVWLDLEIFGSAEKSHKADLAVQGLRKGSLAFVEGHLKLDQWTGQDGQKHSRLKIVVDDFQFLEPKAQGQQAAPAQQSYGPLDEPLPDDGGIPFTWLLPWLTSGLALAGQLFS